MSPRAAWRLETLGFEQVNEYVAGKNDWLASGMPREGRLADLVLAADVLRTDAATCAIDERVSAVLARIDGSPFPFAFALNERQVLLGRLRKSAAHERGDAIVADVMEPGPSTVRAMEPAEALA